MATTKFKGQPVKIIGEFIKTGTVAPDFELVKTDLSSFSLKDMKGKNVILNIFPSLDTSVRFSDFDESYGVRMADGPLGGLLARAVVIIGKDGKVMYTELVPEITQEPDYDKAIEAVKK